MFMIAMFMIAPRPDGAPAPRRPAAHTATIVSPGPLSPAKMRCSAGFERRRVRSTEAGDEPPDFQGRVDRDGFRAHDLLGEPHVPARPAVARAGQLPELHFRAAGTRSPHEEGRRVIACPPRARGALLHDPQLAGTAVPPH